MSGSALREEPAGQPGWGDVRQAVMSRAEACAQAVFGLLITGCDPGAVRAAERAAAALREASWRLRPLAFDEAVVDAERARAADEALADAGLVPPPRRHLHVVS